MSKYSLTPYDMTHWEGLYGQIIGNGPYARVENGLAQTGFPVMGGIGVFGSRKISVIQLTLSLNPRNSSKTK